MGTNDVIQGLNLYLIGMMGAGKTTVGESVAKLLGYRFCDTDAVIAGVTGRSIPEIFAAEGETGFRHIETQVLSEVAAFTRMAIATGGGIVTQRANWSLLRTGAIVWLNVPVEELLRRLQEDATRPLLQDPDPEGKVRSLLEQRRPLYAQADLQIDCAAGESPEQIAQRIVDQLPTIIKPKTLPPEMN